MRSVFSSVSVIALMFVNTVVLAVGADSVNKRQSKDTIIHGISYGTHFKYPAKGPFYIQAGAFKVMSNAHKYRDYLIKEFHQPTTIKTKGIYQVVLIGPIQSAAEMSALKIKLFAPSSEIKQVHVSESTSVSDVRSIPEHKTKASMPLKDKEAVPLEQKERTYFEVIGAASLSTAHAGNTNLPTSTSETDRLVQSNASAWGSWGGQLGIGYVYFLHHAKKYSENVQWLPMIEPELNVYYDNYQNKGAILRFGGSTYNGPKYNAPIANTRLMVDGALTVVSKRQMSSYVIGGIGNAWSHINYANAYLLDNNDILQNLSLHSSDSSHFTWELGAGLAYDLNDTFKVSFQYLYTDFGKLNASGIGSTSSIGSSLATPTSVNLQTQGLQLGLHIAH